MTKVLRLTLLGLCLVMSFGAPITADELLSSPGKSVGWNTPDGVHLVGRYQQPSDAAGLVWVLLHGLGSNKDEWNGFVRQLAAQGDGFLIYDARGHGDSRHQVQGSDLDYRDFRTAGPGSAWDHMPADLKSAVRTLEKRFGVPPAKIAVGGASLGANVALVYASMHPGVPAVILLSPGLEYAGIQIEVPFQHYGDRPLLMAASPGDTYAYASVQQLAAQRHDSRFVVLQGQGTAHGVNMFNDQFTPQLLAWMKKAR
jgi:pimeloyl-ACP methyl ester carboxylesterase